jgi:hypothetical protein
MDVSQSNTCIRCSDWEKVKRTCQSMSKNHLELERLTEVLLR